MAILDEAQLQKMERVHERVLRDLPDDLVAQTMRDACETIRTAWAERDALRLAVRAMKRCAQDAKLYSLPDVILAQANDVLDKETAP